MKPFSPTFSDASKYVYHYTKMETARQHILPDGRIRLSSFNETNDPKESKVWKFEFASGSGRGLGEYGENESLKFSSALKAGTKLFCCSTDSPSLSGLHVNDMHKRGFAKPRMWAQYGRNHSGVCLVFDRRKLGEEIRAQHGPSMDVHEGPVEYRDRGIVGDLFSTAFTVDTDGLESVGFHSYVKVHRLAHMQQLFFEKMSDWKDETEFRWLLLSNNSGEEFVEFKDSLVGIVFGDAACESCKDQVIEATEHLGIHYMGIKWKNCSPWYDFGNLKYSNPGLRKLLRDNAPATPRCLHLLTEKQDASICSNSHLSSTSPS